MLGLYALIVTLLHISPGDARRGAIISFDPPDLNDWSVGLVVKETDVRSHDTKGKLVKERKLDRFSMELLIYCKDYDDDLPPTTQAQWDHPKKRECKGERYNLMKLRYDDFDIDCLRITTTEESVALASFKAFVLKRFHLKVVYLTVTGDCYVKYFELPMRRCSRRGHTKLPKDLCQTFFPFFELIDKPSEYSSDYNVKLLN
ncbi:uncharacterized protein LOC128983333 [Macrosteles quadrilineatus]|uniref:uncharacterized protein LOC128983333 n=1 Tax=Macrosteles quadrilineatus TaxID=74068 RepID=UPI0023E09F4D|nr:uncharacterized protein LOC128983333 [Macrosteles quadrilineatus]